MPPFHGLISLTASNNLLYASEIVHPLMVRWVVGSIPHDGPTEPFLVPASAPQLVLQRLWNVLPCLWDDAYKRTLLLIGKNSLCGGSGFPLSLSEWSFSIFLSFLPSAVDTPLME